MESDGNSDVCWSHSSVQIFVLVLTLHLQVIEVAAAVRFLVLFVCVAY